MEDPELASLAARTSEIYQRNALRFDAERTKVLHERVWLDRWLARVPRGASLLDLGCGTGDPIAGFLLERGYRVTGLDAAEAMLAVARRHLPAGRWVHGDMRTLDLDQRFDGILGWNSFFHLTQIEQRAVLPRLAKHLAPGGALMLSVGPAAGEVVGQVAGEAVYHASLAPSEYLQILERCGLCLDAFVVADQDCEGQTVLLVHEGGTGGQ